MIGKLWVCGAVVGLVACGDPPQAQDPSGLDSLQNTPTAESNAPLSADVDRGQKALEAGDDVGAKAAFEAALGKNPNDAEAHYYLGLLAEQADDKPAAEKHYQAALASKPGLEPAAINLSAYYLDSAKYEEAAKVLEPAVAKNPQSGALLTNQALALANKGDRAGASAAFDKAERLAGGDTSVLILHAQWLTQWKQPAVAKEKLLAARKLAGDDVFKLAPIGFELKNAGAFTECNEVLDQAIQKHGSGKGAGELRVLRGLCKIGLKDNAGALADFLAATKMEPVLSAAFYYLGGRYAEAKKWNEAEAAYAEYLNRASNGEFAEKARERLAAVQQQKKKKK